MFELRNRSPFAAQLLPTLAADGRETALVVVKGTYELAPDARLRVAQEQVPLALADHHYGEPETSSICYASDVGPAKPGTDVVLLGHAHAPNGKAVTRMKVSLEAGSLQRTVLITGDRHWQRSGLLGISASEPLPFVSMPLVYERAFGGIDQTHDDQREWAMDGRNPVGRGLVANRGRQDLSEVPLPNLEDPDHPIKDVGARPAPFGFGFVAPGWEPRRKYAGTYDEGWREKRFPLPPEDFDPRFYNGAPAELVSPSYFGGGELVRITNASPQGVLEFCLPEAEVTAIFYVDGQVTEKRCNLDTVVLEPDRQRIQLTWRASTDCHRRVKYVTGARVVYSERAVAS